IWCCWSCFLLRAPCDRLVRTSISGVRMCVHVRTCTRTRDTYAGIGHAGHPDTKTHPNSPKTPSSRGKNGIQLYFIYFYLYGHQPVTSGTKNTIQHIFFFRTSTFFMLSVNNRDYYFYSLSIQEVLTTRPCGYPAGCSRYLVSIYMTVLMVTTLGAVDFHEISCSFAARVKTGPRVKNLV